LFVGKTLLHGDVLMWLMKTLLTSGCTNQRGAGHHELRYAAITYGLLVRCMLHMINELPITRSNNYGVAAGYQGSSITFKGSTL
ncbi:hypothetical protein K8D14_05455, partial [Enterobacter kobei]